MLSTLCARLAIPLFSRKPVTRRSNPFGIQSSNLSHSHHNLSLLFLQGMSVPRARTSMWTALSTWSLVRPLILTSIRASTTSCSMTLRRARAPSKDSHTRISLSRWLYPTRVHSLLRWFFIIVCMYHVLLLCHYCVLDTRRWWHTRVVPQRVNRSFDSFHTSHRFDSFHLSSMNPFQPPPS